MKILWLCNIMLPQIALNLAKDVPFVGGWLTGLSYDLLNQQNVDLAVCFPIGRQKEILMGNVGKLKYYGFPQTSLDPTVYDKSIEIYLKSIIDDYSPDIVHIFGTEYPHSLAMTKVFAKPNQTVISIQGLTSVCARHYTANLPYNIQKRYTFRDLLKRDNILAQQQDFVKRGKHEETALKNVNHIIGRTTWDKACSHQINPNAKYHFCNETLRGEFYHHQWDINQCEKYSIFISQCSYPIKGFHLMLEAMPEIIKNFPHAHLYTTGPDPLKLNWVNKLRVSSYQLYIKELIIKLKLNEKVTFLGDLNETQMCERFLKSHVFVSPSSIENSPNSVGEAMILGVPTVSSDVGGVKDMLTHNSDGFIYPYDAPYMLAYYVCTLFGSNGLSCELSKNARNHAMQTHSRQNNIESLLRAYATISIAK